MFFFFFYKSGMFFKLILGKAFLIKNQSLIRFDNRLELSGKQNTLPNKVLCWVGVISLGSRQLWTNFYITTLNQDANEKQIKKTVVLFHLRVEKKFGSIRIKSKKTFITTFISFFPFKIFTWNLQHSFF